jgi:heme/copper-type cytochrome/quinol oxidase subunit 2
MKLTRRTLCLMLVGTGACLLAGPAVTRISGQEQPPNRRAITVHARDYRFTPARIEVMQDDLVKLTVESEDVAYSITIDEYRVSKRIPAGGSTTIEFRADRPGTFAFYSNMTSDVRHDDMRGELVVRGR